MTIFADKRQLRPRSEIEARSAWREFAPERPDGIGVIKRVVCVYCRNQLKHGCITECAPEGLYRNLEPTELDLWHDPPKLPSMARLMAYAPVTRLALMHLVLYYLQSTWD
jgi:hypothetical protein